MKLWRRKAALSFPAIALALGLAGCESGFEQEVGSSSFGLSEAQCDFFESGGKVLICHRTRSEKNPYVLISVSSEACLDGHAGHGGDFVSYGDPTCEGLGCFPEAAPCDDLVPCCDGLECAADATCTDIDACVNFPCGVNAFCEDLPPPAPDSPEGRECSCPHGYIGGPYDTCFVPVPVEP